MDKEVLVTSRELTAALKSVVRAYGQRGKAFNLVMLIPSEGGLTGKFSLLVSAPWLDEASPREAVSGILKELVEAVGSTAAPEYQMLARVTVVKSTDPFVHAITGAFRVQDSDITLSNVNISGTVIENAILLESHRPD
jgi:hypothetical protein